MCDDYYQCYHQSSIYYFTISMYSIFVRILVHFLATRLLRYARKLSQNRCLRNDRMGASIGLVTRHCTCTFRAKRWSAMTGCGGRPRCELRHSSATHRTARPCHTLPAYEQQHSAQLTSSHTKHPPAVSLGRIPVLFEDFYLLVLYRIIA